MDKYHKKPAKNAINAAIKMVFQSAHNITAPLAARWPQLGLPLSILVAELNFKLLYHQEELNEFVEYLMENLDPNEPHINFDSEEFTQALTIAVEQFFRLRLEEKKKIAQRIFLECVKAPDLPQFPLERLNTTLQQISREGLQYLVFIDQEIMPLREATIECKVMDNPRPASPSESQEERRTRYESIEPISPYIEEWLKKYDPPELANETQAIAEKRESLRQIKRDDLAENAIEMEQLGLMRSQTDSSNTYVGSGPVVFILTRFGKAFKHFIPD